MSEQHHSVGNSRLRRIIASAYGFFAETIRDMGKWVLRAAMIGVIFFAVTALIIPKPGKITPGSSLFLGIDRPLAETTPFDHMPFLAFLLNSPTISATMAGEAIRDAGEDPNIERIIVSLDGLAPAHMGPAQRLAEAMEAARASGKYVAAYASNFNNAAWIAASGADEIFMHSMGRFDAGGVKAGTVYFGDALKRYGVEMVVGKAGAYKNAIEPFTRGGMSEASRQAMTRLATAQSEAMTEAFAVRAEISTEEMTSRLAAWDGAGVDDARTALKLGLIDRVVDAPGFMDAAFGSPIAGAQRPWTTFSQYVVKSRVNRCRDAQKKAGLDRQAYKDHIGVVVVEGEIRLGVTRSEHAGATSIIGQIEAFARSEHNKGLLVRIDSPGGDAQAAELIRSSIARYKSLDRPVVVSMGSLAASGGYWIATAGDVILAEPTTITGSIGVFAMRPSAADAMKRFEIAWDGVSAGRTSPFGTLPEEPSAREEAMLNTDVEAIYGQFTDLVAKARDLDPATAPQWADGRVWQAHDAHARGLIDEIAGVSGALHLLSERTGVPDSCATLARPVTSAGSMLSALTPLSKIEATVAAVQWSLEAQRRDALPPMFKSMDILERMHGVNAYCFNCALQ